MLMPKRTKYRKEMKGRNRGKSFNANTLAYGNIGIKALEHGRIDGRQIEAARIAMTRKVNRTGKIWITVFPAKPLTAKPLETRMGKGKGSVDKYVMNIKPGRRSISCIPCRYLRSLMYTLSFLDISFFASIAHRPSSFICSNSRRRWVRWFITSKFVSKPPNHLSVI